ncbi:hypothetical protein N0V90_007582 [Kalmusia sp. IMI 367209]|nr:hypothetical protein N0V90_007582 [Kalmusia sp. IMI 367209]
MTAAPHSHLTTTHYHDPHHALITLMNFTSDMEIQQDLRVLIDSGNIGKLEKRLSELATLTEAQLDVAFTYAVGNGSADVVGTLMRHGARLKYMSWIELSKRGELSIYHMVIDNGWDINSTEFGAPAIMMVSWDNEELLRWLLENGANPNTTNERRPNTCNDIMTPLACAALAPETAHLELLLSYGAEMDNDALFRAISARSHRNGSHVAHLKILLDHGADVNYRSRKWGTPLHYAIQYERKAMIEYLLERGAAPTVVTVRGSPVEHARDKGRMDLVKIILEAIENHRIK